MTNKKFVLIAGLLTYAVLFIFAVLFYKERVVMCDAAFQLFSILKEDNFAIQINRFGAAFTQVFPLLASKMNWPLSAVTMVYSLSFLLFYFIIFLIVLLGLKNEKMALVILLFNTIMVRHSFFWIQCEFVQGAVFTLFYLAITELVLKRDQVPRWYYPLSLFFMITIIYFYPLLLFIMLFGFAFLMLLYKNSIRLLAGVLATYMVLFVIKVKFLSNFYDQQSMQGVSNIIREFPHYLQLNSFKNFYRYVLNDYYLLFIFWIVTALYLLTVKKYLLMGLMSAFLFGVCFLINVNFAAGVDQFYLESQYLILVVFVAMPFAWFVMHEKMLRTAGMLLISGSLILSLIRIHVTHDLYLQRVAYIRSLSAESAAKRMMPKELVKTDILRFTWGVSFEAWLLSTIEEGKTVSVVYEEQPGQFDYLLNDPKIFATQMGLFKYDELNSRYFVKDSLTYYQKY